VCIPQYDAWCQRLNPTDSGVLEPVDAGFTHLSQLPKPDDS
jgi:hypothetical protein